jgi:hypothetical protein
MLVYAGVYDDVVEVVELYTIYHLQILDITMMTVW